MAFLKESRAQISAEMIIVLAALLAVAIVLITKLTKTSTDAGEKIDTKTTDLITKIDCIDNNSGPGCNA
ncbi:MAG: hypothetical protein COT14_01850 [Candidatus Diapherotrites archaeon CG08_land_8_20_14_0_20_30_16]|nr:MAG: hypothetical protein COT14_01850 [Candidatus Diapherotrites archaeon CG08_land_8_20_14_0_20_30_16]